VLQRWLIAIKQVINIPDVGFKLRQMHGLLGKHTPRRLRRAQRLCETSEMGERIDLLFLHDGRCAFETGRLHHSRGFAV
jgi:hypothetical protein